MLLWLASVVVLSAGYRRLPRVVRSAMFFFVGFPAWMWIGGAARAFDSFSYGLVCWLSGVMLLGGTALCAVGGRFRAGSEVPRASRRRAVPAAGAKKEARQDAPPMGRRKFRFED